MSVRDADVDQLWVFDRSDDQIYMDDCVYKAVTMQQRPPMDSAPKIGRVFIFSDSQGGNMIEQIKNSYIEKGYSPENVIMVKGTTWEVGGKYQDINKFISAIDGRYGIGGNDIVSIASIGGNMVGQNYAGHIKPLIGTLTGLKNKGVHVTVSGLPAGQGAGSSTVSKRKKIEDFQSQTFKSAGIPYHSVFDASKSWKPSGGTTHYSPAGYKSYYRAMAPSLTGGGTQSTGFVAATPSRKTGVGRRNKVFSYASTVKKYSKQYGVPENLIYSIMSTESGGNPKVTGGAKEYGLMQVIPGTWNSVKKWIKNEEGVDVGDPYNPDNNIHVAARFIKEIRGKISNKYPSVRNNPDLFNRYTYATYNRGEPKGFKFIDRKVKVGDPSLSGDSYVNKTSGFYSRYQTPYKPTTAPPSVSKPTTAPLSVSKPTTAPPTGVSRRPGERLDLPPRRPGEHPTRWRGVDRTYTYPRSKHTPYREFRKEMPQDIWEKLSSDVKTKLIARGITGTYTRSPPLHGETITVRGAVPPARTATPPAKPATAPARTATPPARTATPPARHAPASAPLVGTPARRVKKSFFDRSSFGSCFQSETFVQLNGE